MTDQDALKDLLIRFEVPFHCEPQSRAEDGSVVVFGNDYTDRTLHAPTITGYLGFVTVFEFDAEGKFVKVGAWE